MAIKRENGIRISAVKLRFSPITPIVILKGMKLDINELNIINGTLYKK